jgi:hypothetical protein
MAGLGRENTPNKLLKISAALCVGYLAFTLAGAAALLLPLLATALAFGLGSWTLMALIASVIIQLSLFAILCAAIGAAFDVIWRVPKNGCGLMGGLTSNFPLHFFDAPLPMRPTLDINLVPATVDIAETDDRRAEAECAQAAERPDQWPKSVALHLHAKHKCNGHCLGRALQQV